MCDELLHPIRRSHFWWIFVIWSLIFYSVTVFSASRQDHTNADCFACAMLSHGDEGVIYGIDGQIELDRLIDPFKGPHCASLLGKPKIFIIQVLPNSRV